MFATDYYPFGWEMPGTDRNHNSKEYRYGFNGKEKDQNLEFGSQTVYDYGMRIYNPAIGKFLSVDPLTQSYPWYTPYQFAGNKPIWAIDLDGLEEFVFQFMRHKDMTVTLIEVIDNKKVDVVAGQGGATVTIRDRRTGELFPKEELGFVQYQYFDVNNERIITRRGFDGEFDDGGINELIAIYDDNWWSSQYIGPNNPVRGEDDDDYRREPQDLMDAAARRHDKDYSLVRAEGFSGATQNDEAIPADIALVQRANRVIRLYNEKAIDPYTGKNVSIDTYLRAKQVGGGFRELVKIKLHGLTNYLNSLIDTGLILDEILSKEREVNDTPTSTIEEAANPERDRKNKG